MTESFGVYENLRKTMLKKVKFPEHDSSNGRPKHTETHTTTATDESEEEVCDGNNYIYIYLSVNQLPTQYLYNLDH